MHNKAAAYFVTRWQSWTYSPKLTNVIVCSASLLFCIKQEMCMKAARQHSSCKKRQRTEEKKLDLISAFGTVKGQQTVLAPPCCPGPPEREGKSTGNHWLWLLRLTFVCSYNWPGPSSLSPRRSSSPGGLGVSSALDTHVWTWYYSREMSLHLRDSRFQWLWQPKALETMSCSPFHLNCADIHSDWWCSRIHVSLGDNYLSEAYLLGPILFILGQ